MFDIIILGGGPGGYIAAERAGARGLSVLLVEKEQLGGTCLNVGCIPTKTLLNSAKLYVHAKEGERFGLKVEGASFDLAKAMSWKNEVVERLRGGIQAKMKKYGVETASEEGEILSPTKIRLKSSGIVREGKNLIIATGSSPIMPPIPGAAGNPRVIDSTGLLSISEMPKRLAAIGGGVIGVEFASLFSSLGVKVDIIEMLDEIVPFMDRELAPVLRRGMKSVSFNLGRKVERIEGGKLLFTKDGVEESLEADLILMSVGRRPNVKGFGAEALGLDIGRGGIAVDQRMRTNIPGVYAVGDVTGKSLLAHSASRMGEVAVDAIAGGSQRMRYEAVPWAVYSLPEAAGVGFTEAEARAKGLAAKTAKVSFKMSGRFVAENGFTGTGELKLIAEGGSGRILGLHLVGPYASETIWGAAALIEQEMRLKDLRELIFPHPTVTELIRDAAWELKE